MRTLSRSTPLSPAKRRALQELHQYALFTPETGYKFPRALANCSVDDITDHLANKGRFRVEYVLEERGIKTPQPEQAYSTDNPISQSSTHFTKVSEVVAHPCKLTHRSYDGMSLDLSFEGQSGEVMGDLVFTGVRFMPENKTSKSNTPSSEAYVNMVREVKRSLDLYFFPSERSS